MNKQNNSLSNFYNTYSGYFLWLILLLGACLRLYNLGSHNFWYDEAMSFIDLKQLVLSKWLLNFQFQFYIVLSYFWSRFFGTSELALRSLSLVFGVLSIPLIYKLGKSLFDRKVGLASALILSISPIHIWYSQEARAYSLSVFLTMLTVYYFSLALRNNRLYSWIGFVVCLIAGVYTNYFCFYILIVAGALLLFERYRRLLRQTILSFCLILAVCLPLIPIFIMRFNRVRDIFWVPKPSLGAIAITFDNFNIGYNAAAGTYFITFIIFSLLFILGVWRWQKEKKNELIILLLLLFMPIISTFLIAQIASVYLDRQLMLFSPFYYIIIACGLVSLKKNIIKLAVYSTMVLSIAFCLYNYYSLRMPMPLAHHIGVHLKKPVKPAADYIANNFIEGDAIGYSGPSAHSLFYYLWDKIVDEKINVYSFVIKSKLEPYWHQRDGICFGPNLITKHVIVLDEGKDPYKRLQGYDFKRLWLISSSWPGDGIFDRHVQGVRDWMQDRYSILDRKVFDGIFIDLYGEKPQGLSLQGIVPEIS